MKFRDYFSSDFETCEDHYIPELRSRYYRNRVEDAMNAVIKVAKDNGCMVKYVDKERHEIIFENYKYSATATLTNQYTTTSIDIQMSTNHGAFDFGRGPKYIKKIYEDLDKILNFKGVGLYK